ncbi:cupin domain-containing protein [Sphingorhabdus sp. EL138]|uniref:cupin domain-containing protein n=1 Tax=Sphingorhabdus sp. EL138 TaxID=2073156 RepID=UPI0025D49D5D|nr:cupin domain-containing protein [Sphingorhabdus sp. EL138]
MTIRCSALTAAAFALLSAGAANAAAALGGDEASQGAHAAHASGTPAILLQRPADAAFMAVPGVPSCTTIAPLRGNMATGASTLMVRMRSGCLVPNHWHTPTEELVVLQGAPLAQMKGERPVILKVGSYSQLPSGHIHRFRCTSVEDCLIFMVADAPFDIYFVNESGATLTPEAALAAAALDDGSGW